LAEAFNLAEGIDIENLDGIHECYEITGDNLLCNISFENLKPILIDFCNALVAPLFFFLELPCDEETEKGLKKNGDESFHKDVYYLDNCTTSVILAIIKRYGELLFNDGLVQFGFASHADDDEVFIKKYKLVSVYSKNIEKYSEILANHTIHKEEKIKTVWDNFSETTPGATFCVDVDNETVFDIVDNLKDAGMYFAERQED